MKRFNTSYKRWEVDQDALSIPLIKKNEVIKISVKSGAVMPNWLGDQLNYGLKDTRKKIGTTKYMRIVMNI
jgi:hypothetical protein